MKKILFVITILFVASFAEAKVYVVMDRETGVVKGMADISDDYVSDWNKHYIIKGADESFRGKSGDELRDENGKVRLATKSEIDEGKQEKEEQASAKVKSNALKALGLTEDDIANIKKLK